MSDKTIVLNRDQMDRLRAKGQAFHREDSGEMTRLIRDGSGYSPLPGVGDEVVLTSADLDELEREGELLVLKLPWGQDDSGLIVRAEGR